MSESRMSEFERQLDANPHDWQLRLVYADWLEEQGDDVLATGQRWQAIYKKAATDGWASSTDRGKRYDWFDIEGHPETARGFRVALLPHAYCDDTTLYIPARLSRQNADRALAERIAEVGWLDLVDGEWMPRDELRHVPFEDAGEIKVKFGEATPMQPRKM